MAIAYAQDTTGARTFSATNNHTQSFPSALTLGSARICAIKTSTNSPNITSVTGSTSGAYSQLYSQNNAAATFRLYVYLVQNGAAGAETITVVTSATGATLRWGASEYTGVAAAAIESSRCDQFATGTSITSGTIATSDVDRRIVGIIAPDTSTTTIVPAGGETERMEVDTARLQIQDIAAATAGSYSNAWTLGASQPGVLALLALIPDTASPSTPGWQQYRTRRNRLLRF